jgi:hypothetical protein
MSSEDEGLVNVFVVLKSHMRMVNGNGGTILNNNKQLKEKEIIITITTN